MESELRLDPLEEACRAAPVSECAPGVQPEHHVIGAAGLDDESPPQSRPTAPIGIVRAACKAGKAYVHFGGSNQSIQLLLGDDHGALNRLLFDRDRHFMLQAGFRRRHGAHYHADRQRRVKREK